MNELAERDVIGRLEFRARAFDDGPKNSQVIARANVLNRLINQLGYGTSVCFPSPGIRLWKGLRQYQPLDFTTRPLNQELLNDDLGLRDYGQVLKHAWIMGAT